MNPQILDEIVAERGFNEAQKAEEHNTSVGSPTTQQALNWLSRNLSEKELQTLFLMFGGCRTATFQEISQLMNISRGTAYTYYKRAKTKLFSSKYLFR